jgi:N-6 DNA Methylase
MSIDFRNVKLLLQDFSFHKMFIDELGWSNPSRGLRPVTFTAAGTEVTRRPIAELGGFVVFEVQTTEGAIPDAKARSAIHKVIGGLHHEHVLVFIDRDRRKSVWSWILRKEGRDHPRTHYYFHGQPGDLFIGKLDAMMFDLGDFDAEGNVSVVKVARRVREALDVERVTKDFYAEFQKQHERILGLVEGIPDGHQRRWYVSVLLNRLMFIYFLQKKGFLDKENRSYLQERLAWSRATFGEDRYFDDFLALLFFEGFAKPEKYRSQAARERLGRIRYLNGGLFLPHRIEQENKAIKVPDEAFDGLFKLFERYTWHLDDTPGGDDSAINPSVLGYIFEKYINQKSFGAYYTRPEITDWLCEQTIHRVVLDRVNLPKEAEFPLPDGTPARFDDIADLLLHLTPSLCRHLLINVLPKISLLDPACGSGAFLVAALKAMHSLYGAIGGAAEVSADEGVRAIVADWRKQHPSLGYFLRKQIITQNLYGVDLMEEATEIARLRLFLDLVASAAREEELEPLPNIDFNIMPGNSLVGLLRVKEEQYTRNQQLQLGFREITYREAVDDKNRQVRIYREAQVYAEDLMKLRDEIEAKKDDARARLDRALLELFQELKIQFEQPTWDDQKNDTGKSKKRPLEIKDIRVMAPFHWGYEFDEVMQDRGGFDAILANPPWEVFKPSAKEFFDDYSDVISKNNMRIEDFEKEQKKLLKKPEIRKAWLEYLARFPHLNDFYRSAPQYKNQISLVAGKRAGTDINFYKLFVEQCLNLLRPGGQLGLVVPGSLYSDMGATKLREVLLEQNTVHALFGLSNEKYLFENVHHSYKICLVVATKGGGTRRLEVAFRINPREAIDTNHLAEFLRDRREHLELTPEFVRSTSPDSLSIMELKGTIDVTVVNKMLEYPMLGAEISGAWKVDLCREFHVTDDRRLFKPSLEVGRLPLYEGKMIHQYDCYFSSPRYWVDHLEAETSLRTVRVRRAQQVASEGGVGIDDTTLSRLSLDKDAFRLAFRQVARSTDVRSMICAILPPNVVACDTLLLHRPFEDRLRAKKMHEMAALSPQVMLYVLAMLNSFAVDWFLRQRISAHASMFYVYQLPVPRLAETDPRLAPIATRAAKLTCTTPEFDALAKAAGLKNHKNGVTDPEKRAQLRAEIDGLVAHLYGLTEVEFAHILQTFPVVPEPVREAARNAYRAVARGDVQ